MNITPKTITVPQPSRSYQLDKLNAIHTCLDDPENKVLRVILREAQPELVITISGAEYEALGQWSDDTLCAFLVQKLALQIVE